MKDKLIIIAAGSGSRWDNHTGTTKHLVEIDGESILQRAVRLFDMDTTVIGFDERYKVDGAELIIPEYVGGQNVNRQTYETAPLWNKEGRTLITLGDVFFTEEAVQTIKEFDKREMMFFGREGASITCEYGELFCHSFYPEHWDEYLAAYGAAESLYENGVIGRCEWWEHYRLCDGIDPNRHEVGPKFTEIDDLTDDFDYPEEYDLFIKHYNNEKKETKVSS